MKRLIVKNMKWFKKLRFVVLSLVLISTTIVASFAPVQVEISASNGYISFSSNVVLAAQAPAQTRNLKQSYGITSANTTYSPSATTNGAVPWTNPTNAYADDTSYATAVVPQVTWRATGAGDRGAGAISPVLPAGMSSGDVVFMAATTITGGSIAITTAGSIATWTAVTGSPMDTGGDEKLYVWWGVFTSGTTKPTLTPGGDHCVGQMVAYYNVNTTTPIDVSAVGSETTSDTSLSFATGLTTTYNNEMVIVIVSTGADSNTAQFDGAFANASLASVTNRMNYNTNSNGGGGLGSADGIKAVANSVNTWTETMASASKKNYICIALRPTVVTSTNLDQIYGTYNATDVVGTVTKLEVGYIAWATATQKVNIYTSNDTGSTWSGAHLSAALPTSDPGTTITWIDCTSDFSWNPTGVNNTNLKVKIVTAWQNGAPTFTLDYLPVRITFQQIPDAPTSFTSPSQTATTINLSWALGANSDKTLVRMGIAAYPTSITDGTRLYFGTGTTVTALNISLTQPTDDGSTVNDCDTCLGAINSSGVKYTLPISTVTKVSFWLYRIGTMTTTANVTIRRVSDNSVIGYAGTIAEGTIALTPTQYNFTNSVSNTVEQDVYITYDSGGGDCLSNTIRMAAYANEIPPNDDALMWWERPVDWIGWDTYWPLYILEYSSPLTACTPYYFRAWAYNSTTSDYSTNTADLTQATTCAGTDISVAPTSYAFGIVTAGSTNNTTGNYFTVTNSSSVTTNATIQMLSSSWTSSGTGWTHSDTAAGSNTAALKASTDNGTTWSSSVFIKYSASYNPLWQSLPVGSNFKFGISLLAPTNFNDGYSNNCTIRISAFGSS